MTRFLQSTSSYKDLNIQDLEPLKENEKMKTQENPKNKKSQELKERGKKSLKEKSKKKGEKKNSKKIKNRNIHDSIFRKTYQNKSNALDLFQIILTKKEYNLFKWSTLQTELTTHFNKDWEETIADLIFSVELKEQDLSQESQRDQIKKSRNHKNKVKDKVHDVSRVRFIFLFEHKSYRDPNVAFQLLKYQFYIYEKREKIPIIPIVFYHGEKEWNISCEFKESLLLNLNKFYRNQCDSLLEGMLNFKYRLLNLSDINVESLPKEMKTQSILFLLKYIGVLKKSFDLKYVERCFRLSKHLTLEKRKGILLECYGYIFHFIPHLNINVVESIEKEIFKKGGFSVGAFKFYIEEQKEKAEEKGIEKGREEGIEEGREEIIFKMLKKGVDVESICQLTDLSKNQVLKFQKKYSVSTKKS